MKFFYHYNKNKKCMTIHYRGQCVPVKNIVCLVPCWTKYNKKQPHVVMQGEASWIKIENETAFIGETCD